MLAGSNEDAALCISDKTISGAHSQYNVVGTEKVMSEQELTIDGYVILPPLNPWDRRNSDLIYRDRAPGTFGETPMEAWRRCVGAKTPLLDVSTKIQRLHDRGWRLTAARITVSMTFSEDPLP
ncbi:hypothetical protein I2750_19860 [Bacillus sp. PR5]|nr:hypothetical protein [Bacillus sp. PR5]